MVIGALLAIGLYLPLSDYSQEPQFRKNETMPGEVRLLATEGLDWITKLQVDDLLKREGVQVSWGRAQGMYDGYFVAFVDEKDADVIEAVWKFEELDANVGSLLGPSMHELLFQLPERAFQAPIDQIETVLRVFKPEMLVPWKRAIESALVVEDVRTYGEPVEAAVSLRDVPTSNHGIPATAIDVFIAYEESAQPEVGIWTFRRLQVIAGKLYDAGRLERWPGRYRPRSEQTIRPQGRSLVTSHSMISGIVEPRPEFARIKFSQWKPEAIWSARTLFSEASDCLQGRS